jgi:hypothetical protein
MPGHVLGFAVFVVVVLLAAARFVAGLSVAVAELLRYVGRGWDDDGWSSV